ncbi:MAG TPA: monooxygenase [Gammaproteobacteria bacterium]|nr:monooxygenase [Gammaproteobacteria bacterium]HBF62891.1 monooxygenase [Gammaproteobacteria bacterium]|tara:strand:+ start:1410 stop:3218 length:1809 start_codon:yes stop_codon:yes gene_type:complete
MTSPQAIAEQLGFDPDSLRAKYRAERDKRLRADGNEQYQEVTGDFSHYVDDPYVEPGYSRAPLADEVDCIVVGGGFGGLLTGARLTEAGVKRVRIIEKGGDFGGTWYWNRYPGAACDVESYVYLPLCEELNFVPKEKYTHAPEILAHSRAIGEKFNLYEHACFQTEVEGMEWDEDNKLWTVYTNRGDKMRAQYVCMANGPLNRPKLPGIPGISEYQGHTFHTSRWDYGYTGGGPEGNLSGLRGKRVGIIGTGATAIQCVPHLAQGADELFVFQRTPSSVDVRANRPTDPEWAASLKPGWQQARMDNFMTLVSGGFADEDLVNDGWTEIIRNLGSMVNFKGMGRLSPAEIAEKMELADFQKMEQIRARAEADVADKDTAESLKPYYRQFCKRPCFNDEYLPSFNLPGVHLIDTDGVGVERFTQAGLVANGQEFELDCVIFATGFEVGTDYTRRSGYDLIGRNGQSLKDKWADGIATLHGMQTSGFPNCFIISQAQSGFTVSFPHAMNEQAKHIAYIIQQVAQSNAKVVEVTEEAEQEWVQEIIKMSRLSESFQAECTPGYYNNEGKPNPKSVQNGSYGAGPVKFFKVIEGWREEGTLAGLELR